MKALKYLVIGILLFCVHAGQAQISVNVNLGSPPQWGPVGYTEARYYYLPDVEAYYDVPSSKFIYYNGATWIHRSSLPSRYRNYDLYHGYKVVMTDYHGNSPYAHFKEHKIKYAKGYHGQQQKTYGVRPENGNSNQKVVRSYKEVEKHGSEKKKNSKSGHGKSKKK